MTEGRRGTAGTGRAGPWTAGSEEERGADSNCDSETRISGQDVVRVTQKNLPFA